MDPALKVQTQIRQNAEELSAFLGDLGKWEQQVGRRDEALRGKKPRERPQAAEEPQAPDRSHPESVALPAAAPVRGDSHTVSLTPASIAGSFVPPPAGAAVPKASRQVSGLDPEAAQRERGNLEFRSGDFAAAVKSYTRCLGMKPDNVAAFSNRASAYLKLREFGRAESDCSSALRVDPSHLKSLVRRASARNALGRHRAALQDLLAAQSLEPGSASIRAEVSRTREMLRSAVNRAPFVSVEPTQSDGHGDAPCGPLMPPDRPVASA